MIVNVPAMPDAELHERIAWVIDNTKYRKADFRRAAGTSWVSVNNWAKGESEPRAKALYGISVLTGIPMEWFMSGNMFQTWRVYTTGESVPTDTDAWHKFELLLGRMGKELPGDWVAAIVLAGERLPGGRRPTMDFYYAVYRAIEVTPLVHVEPWSEEGDK